MGVFYLMMYYSFITGLIRYTYIATISLGSKFMNLKTGTAIYYTDT